jgi:hypothetical protein
MSRAGADRRSIGHAFYETRVLLGREYTLKRFAAEVLGGSIDPVMLGYIEKGQRFPSEALVRRLAVARREDPIPLLSLLWRDRMLHAFGKELKRVLRAPREVSGLEDADLAVSVSQAIAALPDDGSPVTVARWRKLLRRGGDGRSPRGGVSEPVAKQAEELLRERGLVEIEGGKVRRRGRHYVAREVEERQSLALEFCALFAKGLLEKLAPGEGEADGYLRNHYAHVSVERLPEFRRKLDEALRKLAEEFAEDESARTRFLNVLVTATTL